MGVGGGAATKAATRLLGAVQAYVFAMEAGSGARLRDVLKVQKDILVSVSRTVVAAGPEFLLYT